MVFGKKSSGHDSKEPSRFASRLNKNIIMENLTCTQAVGAFRTILKSEYGIEELQLQQYFHDKIIQWKLFIKN